MCATINALAFLQVTMTISNTTQDVLADERVSDGDAKVVTVARC
jgi:hypothetical protein